MSLLFCHSKNLDLLTFINYTNLQDWNGFRSVQAWPKSGLKAKCGPWSNFDQPCGLIHKMIWNTARSQYCSQITTMNICREAPTDVHLTTCGPPGKNFGHPWFRLSFGINYSSFFLFFLTFQYWITKHSVLNFRIACGKSNTWHARNVLFIILTFRQPSSTVFFYKQVTVIFMKTLQ